MGGGELKTSLRDEATAVFESLESQARTYSRRFPVVFERARGHLMWDEDGRRYVDFLSGAGALNYGHNHPALKERLSELLAADHVVHSLDLHTKAKKEFLETFQHVVLEPRGMDYRILFTGPTGTNAVEAALKIARRATGRTSVAAFTQGFHGLSLGALALSANPLKRATAGVPLTNVVRLPYDGFAAHAVDSIAYIEALLDEPGAGVELPAAFVVETVQAEGGVRTASTTWLRRLQDLARSRGILLVIDDIQAGCGRTGRFFSFEEAGLDPDVVCLSKSLSGYGLPLAAVLVRPELDVLGPGEHGGTFRGNNLAFASAGAAAMLWDHPSFTATVLRTASAFDARLGALARRFASAGCSPCGRGFLRGLAFDDESVAARVSAAAFERGLMCETSGAAAEVVKLLPPIVIPEPELHAALDVLEDAIGAASDAA